MMTRFVGEIEIESLEPVKLKFPTSTDLPPKREWFNYSIWETNGKKYSPVTANAQANLDNIIQAISAKGYTHCDKFGSRKPSSIKYGIQTYGIEDFKFV